MHIVQVSTYDRAGGAERVARGLHEAYRRMGHVSKLVVGTKRTDDPDVVAISNDEARPVSARRWIRLARSVPWVGKVRGFGRLSMWLPWLGQLHRLARIARGEEDFDYPGTWRLPGLAGPQVRTLVGADLTGPQPDIVHCHNLHGGYFDLRALPWLSRKVPVFLTLHDAWLLTGHCAHPFDCGRWRTGCGECPRLDTPPAIRRDATAFNWRRKASIFAASSLRVGTPSNWLMEMVGASMLARGAAEARVVQYDVDRRVLRPGPRDSARRELGLTADAKVLLFAAHGIRRSPWKDFGLLREALSILARRELPYRLVLVALGEEAPVERFGRHEIRFIPYEQHPERVAGFYRAADLYVHASKADTFPNTVLEALSCGTPVVATAVGGVPEQVKGLARAWSRPSFTRALAALNTFAPDEATGVLVPPGDAAAMAEATTALLHEQSEGMMKRLSENAARDAEARFSAERQAREYLDWYREALEADSARHTLKV